MNHELKVAYQALTDGERQHLQAHYSGSPKALLLIGFLEAHKGTDFTNQQIIPHLYPGDGSSFETLRNRYFKLRKQLLDTIATLAHNTDEEAYAFPKEQAELYRIKQQLMRQGHHSVAKPKLEILVKKLWFENIFELLPEALQSLIYCHQVLGEYRQYDDLYAQWELSITLQRDITSMKMFSAKAFNTLQCYPVDGFGKVLEVMASMKRIVQAHKPYPRFEIAYHLSHLLNGAATVGNKVGALTRHVNAYEKLRKAHPNMPSLFYESNYQWIERFRYLYAKGLYHYMKQDFKTFYQSQAEAFQLTAKVPELRGTRSENMYLNKIRTEVMLGLYQEAQATAKLLIDFQKENQLAANQWKAQLELGRLYVYSFPAVQPDNLGKFIGQLEKSLKVAQEAMGETERGESNGVVAILHFYHKNYRAALQTFELAETLRYFQQTGADIFHRVFALPFSTTDSAKQLIDDIKNLSYRTDIAAFKDLLQRAIFMVEQYAKN